jgi:hydroxymethylpyrimidine pyrophosphatase-like HAD family hydrolase
MFVFDVDGVITDPHSSKVSVEVLTHVANDLNAGSAVAFNTGRPYEWVNENVLRDLRTMCPPEAFDHLLIVAEMGGVLCTFTAGEIRIELDETLSLPGAFITDVRAVLETEQSDGTRLSDDMWWDPIKKTMGSLVKWDHIGIERFNEVRPVLAQKLEVLLKKHALHDFMIGQTTIATDIQHKDAGKHKGAGQISAWLAGRGDAPATFYTFGDSISDKAMAETFASHGANTYFVFVGDPQQGSDVQSEAYETVVTGGGHDTDTAAYLARLS